MSEQSTDPRRKPKGRSPSYPALDLKAALDRSRQLYDRERQHPAAVETIVRHWGYKSLNGPASLALAALKKFGLIEDSGTGSSRRAALTDLAVDILENPDPSIRARATQVAALNPTIHKELWDAYGDASGISDANLRWELTRERRFTETGAAEFIPEFRATMSYAQLSDGGRVEAQDVPPPQEDDSDEDESPPLPPLRRRRRVSTETASAYTIPLVGGTPVMIEGEFPISEGDWAQFLAVLNAMKPGLVEQRGDEQ